MSSPREFSDVANAYNDHVASLDQARVQFEEEVESLNELVHGRLAERRDWSGDGIQKVRWGKPEPWSTAREGPWLNWICGTRIRLDVRPPNYKNFKKSAAFVYFRTRFDDRLGKFAFGCLFTNQNDVNVDFDEEIYRQIQASKSGQFPRAEHIKRNNTLIFLCELENSLFEESDGLVDRALEIVSVAVDALYPDSQYPAHITSSEVDDDGDEDMDNDLNEEEDESVAD